MPNLQADEPGITIHVGGEDAAGDRRVPGDPGVWLVIFGEMAIFGFFFVLFAYHRAANPALYAAGQATMHRGLGLTNTLLLLTSSCFVALSIRPLHRQGTTGASAAPSYILGALACGIGFCGVKIYEYAEKVRAGLTLNSNEFFTLYYMFTGIHLTHVIVGLCLLVLMFVLARSPSRTAGQMMIIESCGIFWHLVDLLWIFLFALFYVAR